MDLATDVAVVLQIVVRQELHVDVVVPQLPRTLRPYPVPAKMKGLQGGESGALRPYVAVLKTQELQRGEACQVWPYCFGIVGAYSVVIKNKMPRGQQAREVWC